MLRTPSIPWVEGSGKPTPTPVPLGDEGLADDT